MTQGPTEAQIGYGSIFQTGDSLNPEEWITLAETTDLILPPIVRDSIDVSQGNAPNEWREFIPGMKDGGEITINLNYTDTAYQQLRAEMDDAVDASIEPIKHRRIVFLNGIVFEFYAFITGLDVPVPISDRVVISVKMKLTGEAGYTPATIPADFGTLAAWFTAYNNYYLTVEMDGTGGRPLNDATVGRWLDRSGNGNHMSLASALAKRPIWRSAGWGTYPGAVHFPYNYPSGAADLRNLATTSINARNCSGGLAISFPGLNTAASPIFDMGNSDLGFATNGIFAAYDAAGSVSTTTLRPRTILDVITWRSSAADLVIYLNGVRWARGSAVPAATMNKMFMNTFAGGAPTETRLHEVVVYNEDIGEANLILLDQYLRNNLGEPPINTNALIFRGDSLTEAAGSETCKTLADYVTNRSDWRRLQLGIGSDPLYGPAITAADLLSTYAAPGQNVVVMWLGTNDIFQGQTGVVTEGRMNTYCTALRAGGCKVVVLTLQDITTKTTEVGNFNTAMRANWTSYADALVDIAALTQLQNSANATYFTSDGIHLKDAAMALIGPLVNTALIGIP